MNLGETLPVRTDGTLNWCRKIWRLSRDSGQFVVDTPVKPPFRRKRNTKPRALQERGYGVSVSGNRLRRFVRLEVACISSGPNVSRSFEETAIPSTSLRPSSSNCSSFRPAGASSVWASRPRVFSGAPLPPEICLSRLLPRLVSRLGCSADGRCSPRTRQPTRPECRSWGAACRFSRRRP